MKKLFSSITAILIIAVSHAQYSYQIINSQQVRKDFGPMASDNNGNTIISGTFTTTLTLGNITLNNNNGYDQAFVAKMLSDGSFAWVKMLNPLSIPNSTSSAHIYGVSTDALGNTYLTGTFNGKIGCDNITLSSTKSGSNYTPDIFVIKMSSSGVFLWAKSDGTSNYPCSMEYGRSVTTDNSGNVYVTGKGIHQILKNNAGCRPCVSSIIVLKYNSSGVKQWSKEFFNSQATGTVCGEDSHGTDIRSDGTNIYVTGEIYGLVSFGSTVLNTGSESTSNVFLLKLDANGNSVFAKSVTGSHNVAYMVGDGLFLDSNNNVYIRGIFYSGTISFGGCSLTFNSFYAYFAKFSSFGNCIWAITPGGIPYGEVMHPDGNVTMLLRRPYTISGWYDIKELSSVNGSAVDSTTANISDTATANIGGYPSIASLPNGFIFSQMMNGTYHFGDLTITSIGSSNNMILIKYTNPAPPIAHPTITATEISSRIILYPNPASNQIMLRNSDNRSLGMISIYDGSGKMIYRKFANNSQTMIDIKNLSAGFYYLKSDQLQVTIKFAKQ